LENGRRASSDLSGRWKRAVFSQVKTKQRMCLLTVKLICCPLSPALTLNLNISSHISGFSLLRWGWGLGESEEKTSAAAEAAAWV
jgi:hypothetical protein